MRIRHIFFHFLLTASFAPVHGQDAAGSCIVSRTLLSPDSTRALEQRVYDNGLVDIVQAEKSRDIAYITYNSNNHPQQIYFTNGSVTKYVYSASGQKLQVVHYVAKPNVRP